MTLTTAVRGAPAQPLEAVGVMVNVTACGSLVVFVKVPLISPRPVALVPVTKLILSLFQEKVVPAILLLETIGVVAVPEHTVSKQAMPLQLVMDLPRQ